MNTDTGTIKHALDFQQAVTAINGVATRKPFSLDVPKSYTGLPVKRNVQRSLKRDRNDQVFMICVQYKNRTSIEVTNDIVDGIAHMNGLGHDTDLIRAFRHAAISAVTLQSIEIAS